MTEFADCSTNIATLSEAQLCQGFGGCGADGIPATAANLNAVFAAAFGRIAAIESDPDNAVMSGRYSPATNILTLTMAEGAPVEIDMATLIADAVGTGLITGSSYDAASNILTLTTANGDTIPVDMGGVIADAIASGSFVPAARAVNTAAPLTGGGALTSDLNLAIDMEALADALFTGGSNANGRWRTYPDGAGGTLIEQKGRNATVANEGTIAVTFPVPFTDAASIVIGLTIVLQGLDSDMYIGLEDGTLSATGFTARYQSTGSDTAYGFHWTAEGH